MRPLGSITRRSAARKTASVTGVVGSTMIVAAMGGEGHDTVPLSLLLYFFHLLIFFIALVRHPLRGRYEHVMTVVCGTVRVNAVAGKDV